jgi:hypothetical protein
MTLILENLLPLYLCQVQTSAIAQFWQLVSGAIALNPESFKLIETLPQGTRVALLIVLLAGLSQALGQIIVLFINRVKPIRFIFSLGIATILFAFGFIFWAISTWIASYILFRQNASPEAIVRTLGLSYAPEMLSFFIALPYLGVPIGTILSVWSFLTFLIGLKVALGINTWQAFWCSVLGWAVFEILQRTIGRPLKAIARWLANSAAGLNLVTDLKTLEHIVQQGVQRLSSTKQNNQR